MEPQRTCVGCRQRANRSELLRVTANSNQLIADLKAVNVGRGAWVHSNSQCLQTAIDRKAFGRALRMTEAADATSLIQTIEGAEKMLASNE
jgi:predicted RNA-binding protein YlxR (DUF448 family)